jgi:hypothetical protein
VLQGVLVAEHDHGRSAGGLEAEAVRAVSGPEVGRGHADVFHVAQIVGRQALETCRGRVMAPCTSPERR